MTEQNTCNCRDCQNAEPVFGLTDVKFVGIDFDPKTIKDQQQELNKFLHQQWSIVKDVQTSNGLVFILGRFGEINSRSQQLVEDELPRTIKQQQQLADKNQNQRWTN